MSVENKHARLQGGSAALGASHRVCSDFFVGFERGRKLIPQSVGEDGGCRFTLDVSVEKKEENLLYLQVGE